MFQENSKHNFIIERMMCNTREWWFNSFWKWTLFLDRIQILLKFSLYLSACLFYLQNSPSSTLNHNHFCRIVSIAASPQSRDCYFQPSLTDSDKQSQWGTSKSLEVVLTSIAFLSTCGYSAYLLWFIFEVYLSLSENLMFILVKSDWPFSQRLTNMSLGYLVISRNKANTLKI